MHIHCALSSEGVPDRFVALTLDDDTLGTFTNSHFPHGCVHISQMFPSSLTQPRTSTSLVPTSQKGTVGGWMRGNVYFQKQTRREPQRALAAAIGDEDPAKHPEYA